MKVRRIDYYDLIALPSGRHIPVPIAIDLVGIRNVLKIPVSWKVLRDDRFYWCEECAEEAMLSGEIYEGSFFKCLWHHPPNEAENNLKYVVFRELILKKQYWKLRYIQSLWSDGFILVNENGKIVGKSFWGRKSWELWAKTKYNPDLDPCKLKPFDKRKIWWVLKNE